MPLKHLSCLLFFTFFIRLTALADTYVVISNADSGPGTLREAITMANAGSMDGALYAINLTTGALKWKYQTGSSLILSSPIVVTKDKRVYYPSDSGKN